MMPLVPSRDLRHIARWFRLPAELTRRPSAEASSRNFEDQNLEYVLDTLMPWLVRWEQELQRKLFVEESDVFPEHALQGLLRGDQRARANFYRDLFGRKDA